MRGRRPVIAITVLSLGLFTACTDSGGSTGTEADPRSAMTICHLADARGLDDYGLNVEAAAGVDEVRKTLGARVISAESNRGQEFVPNLTSLLAQGCDVVVGSGGDTRDTLQTALDANPDVRFLLVGGTFTGADGQPATPANGRSIRFEDAKGGHLAGYLAAGASTTGVVGVLGGVDTPNAQAVMDGFVGGVAAYNAAQAASAGQPGQPAAAGSPAPGQTPASPGNDAAATPSPPAQPKRPVRVVGWDRTTKQGTFAGSITDRTRGFAAAKGLLDQNADVILPVGGPFGLGALDAVAQKEGARAIWPGVRASDLPEHSDLVLASITLVAKPEILAGARQVSQAEFDNEPYLGTVGNGGVRLLVNDDLAEPLPDELTTAVTQEATRLAEQQPAAEPRNPPTPTQGS